MKVNKHFFFVLFMVLSFSAFSCSKEKTKEASSSNNQMQEQVSSNQSNKMKAPDFTLTSTNGKKINLSDYKGKIVFSIFGQPGADLVEEEFLISSIFKKNSKIKLWL